MTPEPGTRCDAPGDAKEGDAVSAKLKPIHTDYDSDRVFDGTRPVSQPDRDRLLARYKDYARRVLQEMPKEDEKV